jgi:hypothetical protein
LARNLVNPCLGHEPKARVIIGKIATCQTCPNKIITFHSNIINEGGFVMGFNGESKRKNLKNKAKRYIGQVVRG